MITPGGGAAPSTPSRILRRCKCVAVVGFLQNNTGRGVGVSRRLRRESKNWLFGKMKMNMNIIAIGSGSGGHLAGVDALHVCPHHVPGPTSHMLGSTKVRLAGLSWLGVDLTFFVLERLQLRFYSARGASNSWLSFYVSGGQGELQCLVLESRDTPIS
ncbi:hypothetical protein AgCh_006919 [Apium graveolens]